MMEMLKWAVAAMLLTLKNSWLLIGEAFLNFSQQSMQQEQDFHFRLWG